MHNKQNISTEYECIPLHLYTFSHNSCGLFIFKKSLKPGLWVLIAVGGANIQIVHFFDHGYLEEEKSMMHSLLLLAKNI